VKTFKALLLLGIATVAPTTTLNLHAQAFRVLHEFSDSSGVTNSDGAQPYQTGVFLAGGTLYGTTYYGGTNGNGVIFSVNTDGSGFAVLHTFSAASPAPDYTNADGEAPQGSLTLAGDTLYGTALGGGMISGGYGTIYSIKTNGDAFTLLHSFDSTNGGGPNGPLVVANGKIYATTDGGGAGSNGTVFSINLDGTAFTVLHPFTNADGKFPNGVVLSGDTLYGNTFLGGTNGNGVVFSINTNGENFTILHTFSAGTAGTYHQFNDDGMNPEMSVVVEGDTIYGTAAFGGYYDRGTLYSLKTDGSQFAVLRTFADVSPGNERSLLDGGGSYPMAISVSNGVLYGVAETGGASDNGVVYSINADGTGFTVLHSLAAIDPLNHTNYDGVYPEGALVLSGNTLYGTAEQGGTRSGNGTVFAQTIVPGITGVSLAGTNLILNGINAVGGEPCTVLMSTDVTLPLNQWTPIATNLLSGNVFSITATNAVDPGAQQRFYTLQVPQY
jgi:uncharacterized repeat protein (TIGR03803 family)